MAQQFNLTAQINLQSPKNVGRVVSDIQRQLKGSGLNTVNIKVKADPRSMAQTNRQLQNVSKNSRAAAKDIGTLNRSLQEATRRFSVITLATGSLLSFVTGFKNATKAAIEFERELVKISQVTGKSVQQLQGLTKEVTRLSTAFGVSSADLLNVSRTLAQAGFNAEKTRKSLDILAKTTLAATFDNIQDTTEGAIALLRQFGDEAKRTGGDVAFLEKSLSAINSVSKKFAVESGDLITVIRRVGGVFSSAGGSINELIALFTSVRATTRESAETIATGLRTIFTRIQRVETINQLKALNIQLQDSQGQFVGAFEAVRRLSQGLSALNPRDFRFNQIVEQLGGFRQIGKVIPLIQQFATAQKALNVAQGASGSVAKDAQTAQQSLAVQIQKVREEFSALIRRFTDTGPFNSIATGALKIASAMIKVTEAVEPLLPLLTTMFGLKIGRALAPGLGRLAGISRSGTGGGAGFSRFNRGGMVPGSGNRDTVPAMLTPGEFVIRKSSVKKLGASRLAAMNQNRFSHGGGVKQPIEIDPKKGTHFTHLDKMITPGKLRKKRGNQRIYSNLGIDLPGSWNLDWAHGLKHGPNNHGVTDEELAAHIKQPLINIFSTLGSGSKKYKLRNKDGSLSKRKTKSLKDFGPQIEADFVRMIQGSNFFLDTDADVVKAKLGEKLVKAADKHVSGLGESLSRAEYMGSTRKPIKGSDRELVKGARRRRKFALGGLATKNRMGFAILDPDQGGADLDAKVTRAQVRGAVSGTDAQRKALDKELSWSSKNYKVTRQGLPAKTSQKFYDTIAQEAANGVGVAANSLSNSLGLGSVSVPEDAKQTMAAVIKKSGSQMGVLFEDVLRVMDSGGPFSPAPKGAPFDFRGGLQGRLKSTYSKMPSSFVDARTSYARSTASAAQGKIIGELAEEYMFRSGSGTYKSATRQKRGPSASEASAAEKRRAKQQARMAKARERAGFAKGGAATDTIPALLTPGEFVFNAKAAKSIGHANLDRMNKRGIQGFARGGSVGERIGNIRGSVGSSLAALDPITQSAQQFVFLGSTVGAVTSQLSGLEDATKTAINESLAFGSGLVGIGATVVSALSAMTVSKNVEKAATDQNTKATIENTVSKKTNSNSTKTSSTGFGKLSGFLTAASISFVTATTALKFFESKALATAKKFEQASDRALKALGEGKFQNINDISAADRNAVASNLDAVDFGFTTSNTEGITNIASVVGASLLAGIGGAIAGGLKGAAVGSAAGPIGTIAGAIVGGGAGVALAGAAGGAAGFGAGVGINKLRPEEDAELKARKENLEAVRKSTEAFVQLIKAQQDLANIERQISDAPGLSDQEKISRRLGALGRAGSTTAISSQATSEINDILTQVAKSTGKRTQNVDEEDIKLFDKSGATLLRYTRAQAVAEQAQKALNDKLTITANALDLATQNLDGTKAFDQLIAEGGQFAESLKARQKVVRESGLAQRKAASDAVKAAEENTKIAGQSSDDQLKAELELQEAKKQEQQVIRNTAQAYNDVEKSARAVVKANFEQAEALAKSKAAQAAVDAEVRNLSKTSEMLDASLLSVANQAKAVDRFVAVLENRTSKIEASRVDEIDDITAIGDINKFAKQVREVSAKGGDATARIGESLIQSAAIMKRGQDSLLGFDSRNLDETFDFEKLIRDATGLDKTSTPGGADVFRKIVENLEELSAKGALSQEDVKSVFAPLAQVAQRQADIVGKLTDREQAGINLYQQKLDALDAVRAKELEIRRTQIDALEKSADLNVRAANLLAKSIDPNALGIDPAAIQQKLADQAAQMSLDDLDLGLQAGNARQIARFRKQAQNNLLKLSQDENVTAKQRMSMERRFIKIIDVTGKELERLGDQSGKAGILMGEMEKNISAIEKERAAREQITGVIEEFVIGGPEERGSLVSAANGIRQAFATGTLQMQTPDQRKATVGLLDRLGDVKLFGNITGKEIRKQLIFKDAIRLGLPPQLAEAIANGTTTEEKLIQANRDLANQIQLLTMQMFMATMAMQANAGAGDAAAAIGAAKGGPIYKNTGGTIFKPRGTDTVPAMLTPGEFVIRKSSVDKIGAGNLAALNNGDAAVVRSRGGPIYRAGGGLVNYLNNGGQGKNSKEERRQFLMASLGLGNISKPDFDKYVRLDQQAIEGARMEGSAAHRTVRGIQTGLRAGSVVLPPLSAVSGALGVGAANILGDPTGQYSNLAAVDFASGAIPGGFATGAAFRGAAAVGRGAGRVAGGAKNLAKRAAEPFVLSPVNLTGAPIKDLQKLHPLHRSLNPSGFGASSSASNFGNVFDDVLLRGRPNPGPNFGASTPLGPNFGASSPASRLSDAQFNILMRRGLTGGGSRNQQLTNKALAEGLDTVNLGTKAGPFADQVAAIEKSFARRIPSAAEEQAIKRGISNRIADASKANRGFTGLSGQASDPIGDAVAAKAKEILGVKLPAAGRAAKRGFAQGAEDTFIHAPVAALKSASQAKKDLMKFLASPAARNMGNAGLRSLVEIYKSMPGVGTVTSQSNQDLDDALNLATGKGILRAEEDAFLARLEKDEPGRISKAKKQIKQFGSPLSQQGGDALLRQRNFQFMMENVVDENFEGVTRGGFQGRGGETNIQNLIASSKEQTKLSPVTFLAARSKVLDAKLSTAATGANAEVDDERILHGILLRREQERVEERARRANTASSLARQSKRGGEKFAAQQAEAARVKKGDASYIKTQIAIGRSEMALDASAASSAARTAKLDQDKIDFARRQQEQVEAEQAAFSKPGNQDAMGNVLFAHKYKEQFGAEMDEMGMDAAAQGKKIAEKYAEYRNARRMGKPVQTSGPKTPIKYDAEEYEKYRKNLLGEDLYNEIEGLARGGPVYRFFGGGIGYGRGGYGPGNTGRMQAARGNQFMMQRFQQGMGFMNQMRNQALSYNISRPGFQNFAGGMGLRARKPSTLYPFYADGKRAPLGQDSEVQKFNSILRRNGPQFALRYAFGEQIPPGAYIGPEGAGDKKKTEELTPEQMNQRMMQMMMKQLQRMEAREMQRQQQQGGFGIRNIRRAAGGGVPGGDTVPAMLTPGEFVMSAGAVRQHGVGTMRALNRGQVPGFNRGGMVGGVQYRQNGGGIMGMAAQALGIDTSEISSTFDNFVGNFSGVLDNITTAFSPITSAIQNLANIFGGSEGIKMNHVHTVTIAAGSAESKLDSQTIDQIAKLAADYVKPMLPDGNDFNVA